MPDHISVLLDESIEGLNIKPNGIYIDGTFGRGGHSQKILEKLEFQGKLIVFDKDPEAIEYAKEKYQDDPRLIIHHGSFSEMKEVCQNHQILGQVDGVLLDLGVSSPQLDQAERGFSFMKDGPLDMRMNPTIGLSAKEVLINLSEKELADIFYLYGEERFSRKIARRIKEYLEAGESFNTTLALANFIAQIMPKKEKNKHPATRVFQALRIYVNQELKDLETLLNDLLSILSKGGRLSAISFHSLEDRIVKQFIQKEITGNLKDIPRGLPVEINSAKLKWVKKKIKASSEELSINVRSRSATLRIAEKL